MAPVVPPYPAGNNLLAGKGIVVTAAAGSGIGFATAKRCAEEGARLVISDIHERRLAEAVEALTTQGHEAHGVMCNVTDEADVQNLIDRSAELLGGIDVMINNAGLGGTAEVHEMTDEQWSRVLDVTLNGTFRCTRAALNHMYEAGSGVIVNNASVLGWRAQQGQAHYAAAKAGVNSLTQTYAKELGPRIRVNCIMPGAVPTEIMMQALRLGEDDLPGLEQMLKLPAGRLGTPTDLGAATLFLCSPGASWVTGQVIAIDGGM